MGQAGTWICSHSSISPEELPAHPPLPWLPLLCAGAGLTAAAARVRGVSTPACGVRALPDPPVIPPQFSGADSAVRLRSLAMHAAFKKVVRQGVGGAQVDECAFGHTSIVSTPTGPCPSVWSTLAA